MMRTRGPTGALGGGAPSPLAFHTLAKDISLNTERRNTFYTWTKTMYYLILPIINIPAPPAKNYPAEPLLRTRLRGGKYIYIYIALVLNYIVNLGGKNKC